MAEENSISVVCNNDQQTYLPQQEPLTDLNGVDSAAPITLEGLVELKDYVAENGVVMSPQEYEELDMERRCERAGRLVRVLRDEESVGILLGNRKVDEWLPGFGRDIEFEGAAAQFSVGGSQHSLISDVPFKHGSPPDKKVELLKLMRYPGRTLQYDAEISSLDSPASKALILKEAIRDALNKQVPYSYDSKKGMHTQESAFFPKPTKEEKIERQKNNAQLAKTTVDEASGLLQQLSTQKQLLKDAPKTEGLGEQISSLEAIARQWIKELAGKGMKTYAVKGGSLYKAITAMGIPIVNDESAS